MARGRWDTRCSASGRRKTGTPAKRVAIARDRHVYRRTAWGWVLDFALPAMQGPSGASMTSTALIDLWILTV